MTKRWRYAAILLALAGHAAVGDAQQPARIPRVGFVAAAHPAAVAARTEAFRQGLRELGYVEGLNVVVDYRYAEEQFDRVPALVDELIRLKADVIVSAGPSGTRSARTVTLSVPIVMAFDADPVGSGVIASLARPGGNVTGLSIVASDLSGKTLELLKSVVPRLARVVGVANSVEPGTAQTLRATREAARAPGLWRQGCNRRCGGRMCRELWVSEPPSSSVASSSSWGRFLKQARMMKMKIGAARAMLARMTDAYSASSPNVRIVV